MDEGDWQTPTQEELQQRLQDETQTCDMECTDIEKAWQELRDATYCASAEVLGFVERKHQDWFDENDQGISVLLDVHHP